MRLGISLYALAIVVAVFMLPSISFPFAAHQFTLWSGSTTAQPDKTMNQVTVTLPSVYSAAYTRSLALAGMAINMQFRVFLKTYLQPRPSDSSEIISVYTDQFQVYSISMYVLLADSIYDWAWLYNTTYAPAIMNDTGSLTTSETFGYLIASPTIIDDTDFTARAFLTGFVGGSINDEGVGLHLRVVTVTAPSDITLNALKYTNAMVYYISYSMLLINQTKLPEFTVIHYFGNYVAMSTSPLTSPTIFNLPAIYQGSSGFDGSCVIGLANIGMGGNQTAYYDRTFMFDAHSNPFTNVQFLVHQDQLGNVEYFFGEWVTACFSTCPAGTYYNVGTCSIYCSVPFCSSCTTSLTCNACFSPYILEGNAACNSCQNVTGSCLTCVNSSYCLTCVSSSYGLDNTSFCELCSSLIIHCQYCLNYTFCTSCYFGYTSINASTACFDCFQIALCTNCLSQTQCIACVNTTYAANSTWQCQFCYILIPNCIECDNSSYCIACLNSSYSVSSDNSLCQLCSALISDCLECNGPNFCIKCVSDSFYLALSYASQFCLACSFPLSNCVTCTDATHCTSCDDNRYYLQNGQCYPCSTALSGCLECSVNSTLSEYNCTLCGSFLFLNTSSQCQTCDSAMSNCSNCTNNTYCIDCINANYGFSSSLLQCVACSQIFPNCVECTNFRCTLCLDGLQFIDGGLSCGCLVGNLVAGLCTSIVGCTLPINEPDGTQSCAACNSSMFQSTPVNGLCECLDGKTLINKICTDLQGCITPIVNANGSQTCAFCNISLGFLSTPDSSGQCACNTHFQFIVAKCTQICGDGLLMISTKGVCDDGNLQDGDGCSSSCEEEVGYRCYNGSSTKASSCVYQGIPLSLTLNNIERTDGLNQGIFQFTISPALISIKLMSLSQYVQLSCQSTYSISDISYSSGTFKIVADYTTDMEGFPCELSISFDSSIIISPNATLSFSAVSRNTPLIVSTSLSEYSTIKVIFGILSYLLLALFVLSLTHKMIGVQLLFSAQIVYLSNAFFGTPSFLGNAIKNFHLVTGYWSFFYVSGDKKIFPPFTERVELTNYFIQDTLFVFSAIGIFFIIWSILLFCKSLSSEVRMANNSKLKKAVEIIYFNFLFPLAAGFICVISIAAFLNSLRFSSAEESELFSEEQNSATFLAFWAMIAILAGVQFLRPFIQKNRNEYFFSGLQGAKSWYIPIFSLRLALIVIFIELGICLSFDQLIFLICIVFLGYFISMLFMQPYNRLIDNLGVFVCQLTSFYASFLPLLHNFVTISDQIQFFMILILEVLLIISALIATIRICLVYKILIARLLSKERQSSQGINPLQGKELKEVEEQLVVQEMEKINPYSAASIHSNELARLNETLFGRLPRNKNREHSRPRFVGEKAEEDHELQVIKTNLKKNLFKKRRFNDPNFS